MTDRAITPYEEGDNRLTMGQTHLDPGDFQVPRVKVIQQMSAEATAEKDPAKPGEFWNTLTQENYGAELRFIPILPFKQRILLVRSNKVERINEALGGADMDAMPLDTAGLACRSYDMLSGNGYPGYQYDGTPASGCAVCPLSRWTGQNVPPLCTETYNVAAITELGELIVLGFSKSSAKTGKQLFTMVRMSGRIPYVRVYEARTVKQTNDQGTFFVPLVAIAKGKDKKPLATPPELMVAARDWASQLQGAVLDVTPDDAEPGDAPESGDEPF